MDNKGKLILSLVMIAFGIWLLLPKMPYIKPVSSFGIDIVWWPYLLSLIKGAIPIVLLAFGGLLFWIEFDEFRSSGIEIKSSEEDGEGEEEEMPAFEDVEYKDLECPECGEDFKTDIGLKVHRKVNHPDSYKGD